MNSKFVIAVYSLSLAVVSVIGYKTRNIVQDTRIETCKTVMNDLYEDMGLKAVDQLSLDKFCRDKFNK